VNAITVPVYHQTEEDMSRNINGILQLQKEQKARQKKAAMVRIGIGAGFLVILVIGLSRRRRKAGESTLQLSRKVDSKTQP
ncbi:MAG: hypothetical protein H7Y01_10675, partial [Ferruginibacter sp.]|nr:hypothetical protein [Chitinophagaceae bacterium]